MPQFTNDFSEGASYFVAGVKAWATKPKLMLLGAIPAVIVSIVMFLIVAWSVPRTYGWAAGVTGFADDWTMLLREGVRLTLGVAFSVAIIMFCIVSFVALTLFVGSPFYEQIWKATERSMGGLPAAAQLRFTQQVSKEIAGVGRMMVMALTTSVIAILIGLIPLVGSVLAAIFVTWRGSRALAVELTAYAADARGWSFDKRKRALDARPMKMLGSSLPFYLAFVVPGGAVLGMPAAVVAGTLLVRDLDKESSQWHGNGGPR